MSLPTDQTDKQMCGELSEYNFLHTQKHNIIKGHYQTEQIKNKATVCI